MTQSNPTQGIIMMILATLVFATQDAISRHLAAEYNVYMVVMIRYWFFAAFVIVWARSQKGSIAAAAATKQPLLQIFRGVLLVLEICVMVYALARLGLVESLAIFTAYPLIAAALSGPVLGEAVGWRRWTAIFVGFIGVLFILQPGSGVFSLLSVIPLISAILFAFYGLLTRYAARQDSAATSFFWTGTAGAVGITIVGLFHMEPMGVADMGWMALLCITGALGHFLLIKCYELAEVGTVQPFAYFHFVFGASIGLLVFGEAIRTMTLIGVTIIVAAGLFTLWRERANT